MVMQVMRKGASNKIVSTILFGLLLLAAIGLAISGGNGRFIGEGMRSSDVAIIGHDSISLPAFDRTVRRTLARANIPPSEAFKLGYIDQILAGEVRGRVLEQAARQNGLMISRRHVAEQITRLIAPMTRQGGDPKQILAQVLAAQGMSERELADTVSRETVGSLMTGTLQSGFTTISDDVTDDLYLALNEIRDVQYIVFSDKDVMKDIPPPAEENLKKLYDTSKERFAIPETRVLQIVRVKDDALKKTLAITDEELKQAYDDQADTYRTPARHVLEQLVLISGSDADKLYDAVKGGKTMEQAARDADQISSYVGVQAQDDDKLPPELKTAVMAAKKGDLLAPVKSPIGWHVIRVKDVTPAQTKSFDQVKDELKKEIFENKLTDQRYALANQVDDLMASGASLEDAAKQVDLDIATLPAMNARGQDDKGADVLKDYGRSANTILETGFKLSEGETSAVSEMADGSFIAVHVKTLTPKSYQPFDKVKAQLLNEFMQNMADSENKARVMHMVSDIAGGRKTFKDIAAAAGKDIKILNAITRNTTPPAPLTKDSFAAIFALPQDKAGYIGLDQGAGIALVTGIRWPDKIDPKSEAYNKFHTALLQDAREESVAAYVQNKATKLKARTNDGLIQQTYGAQADTASE